MRSLALLALVARFVHGDTSYTICPPPNGPTTFGFGPPAGFPLTQYDSAGPRALTTGRSFLMVRCSDDTPSGTAKQSFTLVNPQGKYLNIVSATGSNCDTADMAITGSSQRNVDDGVFSVTTSSTSASYTTNYQKPPSSNSKVCLRVSCADGSANCGTAFYIRDYKGQRVQTTASSSVGATAGGVVAGVLLLVLIVALACYCKRRRQQMQMQQGVAYPPVMAGPGAG